MTTAAILTAVRERLDGTSTELRRRLAAGLLAGDVFRGLPEEEAARRALVTPRFAVRPAAREDAPNVWEGSTRGVRRVRFDVVTVYHYSPTELTDEDARFTLLGLAGDNAELVRRALMTPGTMLTTNASVDTGLVSGCFTRETSSELESDDPNAGTVRWRQQFEGFVKETITTAAAAMATLAGVGSLKLWLDRGAGVVTGRNGYGAGVLAQPGIDAWLDQSGNLNHAVSTVPWRRPLWYDSLDLVWFGGQEVLLLPEHALAATTWTIGIRYQNISAITAGNGITPILFAQAGGSGEPGSVADTKQVYTEFGGFTIRNDAANYPSITFYGQSLTHASSVGATPGAADPFDTNAHYAVITYDGSGSYITTSFTCRFDAAAVTPTTGTGTVALLNTDSPAIGALYRAAGTTPTLANGCNAYLHKIALFDRVLASDEITLLESYLSSN